MRRALLLTAAVAALASTTAFAAPSYPERLLITADEWSLVLSRSELRSGPAIIELYNRGEDAHDVKIKRRGRKKVVAIPETTSEASTRIETTLRPDSRYVLWCSLRDHRELGMKADLSTRG